MLGLPGGGTLWNAICATTMKRRSILEYTTHKSTFCMLCMHRTLISIRIYIYTYVYMVSCGLHTIIHRYQSDIRYPQQRGPGPLGCFGSWCPQKNSPGPWETRPRLSGGWKFLRPWDYFVIHYALVNVVETMVDALGTFQEYDNIILYINIYIYR
jgi:hypothetical protein